MVPEKEHLIFDLGLHIHIYAPVFTHAYILAHKWKHRLYIIFGHVKLSIIHYCWFHRHKKVHCEDYSSLRLLWWMHWMSCGWVAMVWKAAVHVGKTNTPMVSAMCLECQLHQRANALFTSERNGDWSWGSAIKHLLTWRSQMLSSLKSQIQKEKRKKWVGLASSSHDTLFCIWIFSFVVFKISCSWHTCLIKDEKN